ncbi:hypothetical protein JCM8547_000253 [Rhodosporidiobolus lusitaniae]
MPSSNPLLSLNTTSPVSLSSLALLSPAHLALASLRPDLPLLVRQRAYCLFTRGRREYVASAGVREVVFDHPLEFAPPDKLGLLSDIELLLLQFSSACTSPEIAEEAGRLFLSRAEKARREWKEAEAKEREREKKRKKVDEWNKEREEKRARLSIEGEDKKDEEKKEEGKEKRVELEVRSFLRRTEGMEELVRERQWLVVGREGLRFTGAGGIWEVRAEEVWSFTYASELAGDTAGHDLMDCTLLVSYSSPPSDTEQVELKLGMVSASNDDDFLALREAVGRWSEKYDFPVQFKRFLLPPEPSRKRRLSPISSTSNGRPPSEGLPSRLPPSVLQSRSPSEAPSKYSGRSAWEFVSDEPAVVEWQPGFFTRLSALLDSLLQQTSYPIPIFSAEELALLSFSPDLSKLPPLPIPVHETAGRTKVPTLERLAIEHIYHGGERKIDLLETRTLLISPLYCSVRAHALLVAKIVQAKDAALGALHELLLPQLRASARDPTTTDPVERIISVVENLARDPNEFVPLFLLPPSLSFAFQMSVLIFISIPLVSPPATRTCRRRECFAFDNFTLATDCKFLCGDLGMGPIRRYEDRLKAIVEAEEEALGMAEEFRARGKE